MRRLLTLPAALLLLLGTPMAAHAVDVDLGGEVFLVKDKNIGAIDFTLAPTSMFAINLELGFVSASGDAPRRGLDRDDDFLGFLLGGHLQVQQSLTPLFTVAVGTGVDYWPLVGINKDEYKVGMPVYLDVRVKPLGMGVGAFLRSRYYMLHSDGLLAGESYSGEESMPILTSVGVMGVF